MLILSKSSKYIAGGLNASKNISLIIVRKRDDQVFIITKQNKSATSGANVVPVGMHTSCLYNLIQHLKISYPIHNCEPLPKLKVKVKNNLATFCLPIIASTHQNL